MPINYKEYPPDWKMISRNHIKAAGNRCELCWAPNGERVTRFPNTPEYCHPWAPGYMTFGKTNGTVVHDFKKTKIVLTTHHIDGDHYNNTKQSLIALCQRCHLRLDLAKHMKKRAAGRAAK